MACVAWPAWVVVISGSRLASMLHDPESRSAKSQVVARTMARDRLSDQAREDLEAVRIRLNHQLKLVITPSVTGEAVPTLQKANGM